MLPPSYTIALNENKREIYRENPKDNCTHYDQCVCVLTSAHAFSNFMRVTKSLFSIHFGFKEPSIYEITILMEGGFKN